MTYYATGQVPSDPSLSMLVAISPSSGGSPIALVPLEEAEELIADMQRVVNHLRKEGDKFREWAASTRTKDSPPCIPMRDTEEAAS